MGGKELKIWKALCWEVLVFGMKFGLFCYMNICQYCQKFNILFGKSTFYPALEPELRAIILALMLFPWFLDNVRPDNVSWDGSKFSGLGRGVQVRIYEGHKLSPG